MAVAGDADAARFILTLSCRNRPGIVGAVGTLLFRHGADITEAQQFDDHDDTTFFMRVVFRFADGSADHGPVAEAFAGMAREFGMDWAIVPAAERPRLLILVSKFDHCLVDLLYRVRTGELTADIAGVIANHPRETYGRVDFDGIAFDHLPVSAATKRQQEAEIWRRVVEQEVDLVVLARYMQVLSDDLAGRLAGRCINIHHSFLPGFKGARPYHQAHARGVKLIGATAHYVTSDLDEGPIIEQDIERITHADTPEMLIRRGRDIERRVLARAVRWHIERRVLLSGRRTVVFGT